MIKACEKYKNRIEYRIINLTLNNWLREIQEENFDILLAKPGGFISHYKQLFDELIYILSRFLGHKIFPSAYEIFIFENKRNLSY
jgi:hypothetical protein